MHKYKIYIDNVKSFVSSCIEANDIVDHNLANEFLGSGPKDELRNRIDIPILRRAGAFFTTPELKMKFAQRMKPSNNQERYLDPTCGAGDLLLLASTKLPIHDDLCRTLQLWTNHLFGIDKYEYFVQLTKQRLILEAIKRGAKYSGHNDFQSEDFFNTIRKGDALKEREIYKDATVVLTNPPYGQTIAPSDVSWAKGKVTAASIFTKHFIDNVQPGTRIIALLPEVLRSGTRYTKWRAHLSSKLKGIDIEVLDQFDTHTDVHVFILDSYTLIPSLLPNDRVKESNWLFDTTRKTNRKVISDNFLLRIGPVVPFRDEQVGRKYPFLHAKNSPAWGRVSSCAEQRQYSGSVYRAPFIVIRRTSRPGDKFRAVGTLVLGDSEYAIENHLIIAKPKDNKLSSCIGLMRTLQDSRTTEWLDNNIRCRHLTIKVLSQLPDWERI